MNVRFTKEQTASVFDVPETVPAGPWAERRRLAELLRRIVARAGTSHAREEVLAEANVLAEQLAVLLEAHPSKTFKEGIADSSVLEKPSYFADQNPLTGRSNPLAPPVVLGTEGDRVVGEASFGRAYEGPPGSVHGGVLAAAFDQVIGQAMVGRGIPGLTVSMSVRYLKRTPLSRPVRFEAWLDREEGRRVYASGRALVDGAITAEAECVFAKLDGAKLGAIFAEPGG